MRRLIPALALALAATAACGTTVPVTSTVAAGNGGTSAGDSLGAPAPGQGPAGADGTTQTTDGALGSGSGGAGSVPGTGSGAGGTGTGAVPQGKAGSGTSTGPAAEGAPRAGSVPGTGKTGPTGPATVGFFVLKDIGKATKSLGTDGLSSGDGLKQAQASVKLLNSRGGLAGRPVKPVVFEYDASQNAASQFQAACSLFFDDNKVVAVVGVAIFPQLVACSGKRGVPYVSGGSRTTSADAFSKNPLLVSSSMLSLDRVVPLQIQSLKAQGWLTKSSKVGLLFNDEPDYAGAPGLVESTLKRLGLPALLDKQAMPGTDDTSRASVAASTGQNAALRFASRSIDRVLVVDKIGSAVVYFGLAAENGKYYPAYGLSSLETPNVLRKFVSARSLENARGVGWYPTVDQRVSDQQVTSSNFTLCLKAMEAEGEDMKASLTRLNALGTCDGALLLGASWKDSNLSAQDFLSGLRGLGTRYPAVMTFRTDFTNRRDGAAQFRPFAFDKGCDCFSYTGGSTTAP